MITGQTKLAKTSATPGKTKLINHFEVISSDKKKWNIADLPGYGYAATVSQKARNNWGNMIESYIRKRENLVCVVCMCVGVHMCVCVCVWYVCVGTYVCVCVCINRISST